MIPFFFFFYSFLSSPPLIDCLHPNPAASSWIGHSKIKQQSSKSNNKLLAKKRSAILVGPCLLAARLTKLGETLFASWGHLSAHFVFSFMCCRAFHCLVACVKKLDWVLCLIRSLGGSLVKNGNKKMNFKMGRASNKGGSLRFSKLDLDFLD